MPFLGKMDGVTVLLGHCGAVMLSFGAWQLKHWPKIVSGVLSIG